MAMSRKTTTVLVGTLGLFLLGVGALMSGTSLSAKPSYIDPSDTQLVTRGQPLYATHCASCHGAQLEGQPNWRVRQPNGRLPAPPHDASGHTWHHSDTYLIEVTKRGLVPGVTAPVGYQSDMPAYQNILSEKDIHAVLAYIKSAWPEQARLTQKDITQRQQ